MDILDKLKEIEIDLFRSKANFIIECVNNNVFPYEFLMDLNNFINTKVRLEIVKPILYSENQKDLLNEH